MHGCQIVKHITQTFVWTMIASLVFVGAHHLYPSASLLIQLSGGRDLALQRGLYSLPTMLNIVQLLNIVQHRLALLVNKKRSGLSSPT